MEIAIASDHGGFELKEIIKEHLKERGINTLDLGAFSNESVDYPVYGKKCAEAIVSKKVEKGIVCCGTGIGISIAANRIKGIRCALATNVFMAEMAKCHNNANMLALGGRVLDSNDALEIVDIWLDTEFEGGRHQRRIDLLDQI